MHQRRKGRRARVLAALVTGLLLLFTAVFLFLKGTRKEETRGTMTEGFGQRRTVEWQGQRYGEKYDVETFLVMGIDKTEETQERYRDGGQADVLLLVVADHEKKKVHLLQLDRDTMAMITVLGINGDDAGLHLRQICLAHGYGETQEINCRYTVEAVSRLMDGMDIDGYMSMNLTDIAALNHALGGVTVTIEDDFTAQDPEMAPGAVLTLTDSQASLYLHSRMSVGDGLNESRMRRHRTYLASAIRRLRERAGGDSSFINVFIQEMLAVTFSDIAYGKMINEMNRIYGYEVGQIETLPGEHAYGTAGFMEFHADEEAITRWVMEHLYEPI